MTAEPLEDANPGVWALAYAELGWRALPITPGKKWPPMQSWPHAASTNPGTIRSWFKGLYRGFGVGIATGEGSGIFAVDVDTYAEGGDTLHELERRHGELPVTVEAITGGDGRHLIFAHPGRRVLTVKGMLPGIDVRGDGGQIVVAPTVHPNGNRYRWHVDLSPWDVPVATAPDWLIALVTEEPELPPEPAKPAPDVDDSDSIARWINDAHDWSAVLAGDGWTPGRPQSDQQVWTRPGKDPRDGHSAVLHLPDGPFVVFSTDASLAPLMQPWAKTRTGDGWSYSMFGYLAATRFTGDRSECARQYRRQRNEDEMRAWTNVSAPMVAAAIGGSINDAHQNDPTVFAHLVDWAQLFSGQHAVEEWVAWPFVPRGRAVALFAPAKAGKSTVVLAVVAAVATGRSILGARTADRPAHVLYLDYEMTEADLLERLEELGYGPDDDLSHLHYALLPSLPPLDTKEGAAAVVALAKHVGAELVVVDTFGRAVEGDENDADTTRAFYRHTGLALKAAGIGVLRTDHAGKDVAKGQRGSSAKNDDVDIVWRLTRGDDGVRLDRTHSRVSWGPSRLSVKREETDDGVVEFITADDVQPTGTFHVIDWLDELGVDAGASQSAAIKAIRAAGYQAKTDAIRAAQRQRRGRGAPWGASVDLGAPQGDGVRRGANEKHQVDGGVRSRGADGCDAPSVAPHTCVPLGTQSGCATFGESNEDYF